MEWDESTATLVEVYSGGQALSHSKFQFLIQKKTVEDQSFSTVWKDELLKQKDVCELHICRMEKKLLSRKPSSPEDTPRLQTAIAKRFPHYDGTRYCHSEAMPGDDEVIGYVCPECTAKYLLWLKMPEGLDGEIVREDDKFYYYKSNGDSLWKIAKCFKMRTDRIAEDNPEIGKQFGGPPVLKIAKPSADGE